MAGDVPAVIEATELRFGFSREREFLGPVTWAVGRGQFWGVLGPNGAGKSTLLRLLVGIWEPVGGTVYLEGRPLFRRPGHERARIVAFLPQHPPASPWATADEIVLMGRFPHGRYRLFESPEDLRVTREVMEVTGTAEFAGRAMGTLSGGEAQRVHLAAALAQQARVLVLDEPTAALDLYHQIGVFELLRTLAHSGGVSVIAVTHDLNLAGRYCDALLLLDDGHVAAAGGPDDVLRGETLERVYGVTFLVQPGDGGQRGWVLPVARAIRSGPRAEGKR